MRLESVSALPRVRTKKELAAWNKQGTFLTQSISAGLLPKPGASCQKDLSPMSQSNLRLVEGTSVDKTKALDAALSQIERAFGKGSIMRLGKNQKAVEI